MKVKLKYLVVICAVLTAGAGFLPLMSKNGIQVNGFQPQLGLGVGYWMLGLGITVALLSFAPGRTALRLGLALAGAACFLSLDTCRQAYKLDALSWGAGLMAVLTLVLFSLLLVRALAKG